MQIKPLWAVLILAVFWNSFSFAQQNDQAKISLGPVSGSPKIDGIYWRRVVADVRGGDPRRGQAAFATIYLDYTKPGWRLAIASQPYRGGGSVSVPLTGPRTAVSMVATGPSGQVQKLVLVLDRVASVAPQYSPVVNQDYPSTARSQRKRYSVSASLGPTTMSYTQTGKASFSENAITAKGSFRYSVGKQTDVGLAGYMTALALSSNLAGYTARFYGLNARIGYTFSSIPAPWSVSLHTGFYLTSMRVTDDAFGFENLMGFQLFPSVRRQFGRSALGATFKFAPIGRTLLSQSFSTGRELALGLQWEYALRDGHAVFVAGDGSDLFFEVEDTKVHLKTFSVALGYAF